jgi:hypothetical protein
MEEEEDIDMIIDHYLSKQQNQAPKTVPFCIQDPLVVDIDRITKTGVVATGKHRKNQVLNRSEHKILFWEYPNWKLKRTFELNLTPPNLTCQIIGIQSLPLFGEKATFFSLAIGMALIHEMDPQEDDIEDRVDIWKSIFIYRLFDNGSTQCVANIKVSEFFLGREIFLFSDTSWNSSNQEEEQGNDLQDWLQIVSPKDAAVYDKRHTIFLLAIGPVYERITGCVQLSRFDLRAANDVLDPSLIPVVWDNSTQLLVPLAPAYVKATNPPTEIITSIKLGTDVSCMIHFKYPPYLNHLICTGSYQDDELSVYDWRFGIKVGTLPWKTVSSAGEQQQQQEAGGNNNGQDAAVQTVDEENDSEEEEDDDNVEAFIDVRPWGLESTLVLPPHWTNEQQYNDDLSLRGFRLIAVGDNRSDNSRDKLEIKVWDISYLLQVKWNPFISGGSITEEEDDGITVDLSHNFPWWPRRTKELTKLTFNMIQQQQQQQQERISGGNTLLTTITAATTASLLFNNNNNAANDLSTLTTTLTTAVNNNRFSSQHNNNTNTNRQLYTNSSAVIPPSLPYSPPKGFSSMLLSHTFDKDEAGDSMIPVKYTAYNVLYTSLFLLTEDGKVTVMDIESGKITGTVENVAAAASSSSGSTVRGIDVNVIGGKEVVVTSKEGLLRGIVN